MSLGFSYRHLYYFWVVACEGSMTRAAARLGIAVQTLSAQVRTLERELGHALLRPAGRGLALTDAGEAARRQADQIFQLGEELPGRVRDAAVAPALRLAIGVSDGLPKLVVRELMRPLLATPQLRLVSHEGDLDELLGEVALHRLDLVLADRPASPNPSLRLFSHRVDLSPIGWFAPPEFAAEVAADFPAALDRVPVLLPASQSALRLPLEQWFERNRLRPRIAGEFEDHALMTTFAAGGMGVFPAALRIGPELEAHYGLAMVGRSAGLEEAIYATVADRRIAHPLVQRLIDASRASEGRAAPPRGDGRDGETSGTPRADPA